VRDDGQVTAEPTPPRRPKGAPVWAALYAAFDSLPGTAADRTVLSASNDPFRLADADTTDAAWLADAMATLGLTAGPIHNRGLHYAILSAQIAKPDGNRYTNTAADWNWLQGVSTAARWLGYVDFDAITDERNAAPLTRLWTPPQPQGYVWLPELADLMPSPQSSGFDGSQPYHLAIVGEKSSLETVLAPIADEFEADLYLPTGNISNTMVHTLAKTSAADGRPLRVFYFADCDPSGWNMSVEVGRKLQAFAVGWFPDLKFACYRVGLTPDQVRELGLPQSPIKETDRRGVPWETMTGVQQTEIDALATLQPDLLRQIARAALSPFFDHSLAARVATARRGWIAAARQVINRRLGDDLLGRLTDIADELGNFDADGFGLPAFELPSAHRSELPKPRGLIISSAWDFAKQTDRLLKAKSYNNTSKAAENQKRRLHAQREQALKILAEQDY
jgi:hypothetical protein